MFTVEFRGIVIRCDSPAETMALVGQLESYHATPSLSRIEKSLETAAALAEDLGKPARKKPGPKAKVGPTPIQRPNQNKAAKIASAALKSITCRKCKATFLAADGRQRYCLDCKKAAGVPVDYENEPLGARLEKTQ